MSNGGQEQQIDFTVDRKNLYREESITDLKVASIRRLIPITVDGSRDTSRGAVFVAHTQLMSPEGPLPLQARLKATSLDEAIAEFPGAMEQALADMVQHLKKMREQQQQQPPPRRDAGSRIIVPGR